MELDGLSTFDDRAPDPGAPPSPAVIDPVALDGIRELQRPGEPSLLARFIDLFVEHAPATVDALESAARAGDREAATRHAHGLKSDCMNLGAARLAEAARSVERSCREGRLAGVPASMPEIRGHLAAAKQALRSERERELQGEVERSAD